MALIPRSYFDCVVAIGDNPQSGCFKAIGTGFFYGSHVPGHTGRYYIYLVTNAHVVRKLDEIWVLCNPSIPGPAMPTQILWNGIPLPNTYLHPNPSIDLCVLPIPISVFTTLSLQVNFFRNDQDCVRVEKFEDRSVFEGNNCYLLGFPLGITGNYRSRVIVKGGCIARISDCIERHEDYFLIDISAFPGNSGGPVITTPETYHLYGTGALNEALLLGVFFEYIPYREWAVSERDIEERRLAYVENSGLAKAYPFYLIDEAISVHRLEVS